MATKVDRLLFTRKRLIRSIESQTTAIAIFTTETAPAVQVSRNDALETLWAEFKENGDIIETTRDWVGTDEYLNEYEQIHEKYMAALVTLLNTMPEQTDTLQQSIGAFRQPRSHIFVEGSGADQGGSTPTTSTPHNQRMTGLPATIKLAPLPIKPFSGKIIDWPEFEATCESTFTGIMDEVNRFRYLKSHLSEEPYRLVKHLPPTAGSYEKAFKLLKNRYNNERAIINANLKRLIRLPILETESSQALKHIVDTTNECITAINSYGIDTDSWSCMLIFLLSQRLDPSSIKNWEEKLKGRRTVPPYSEFMEFLETRINVLESTVAHDTNNVGQKKAKTFVNIERARKCNICADNTTHFTYTCPELIDVAPAKREQFVQEKGLCVNCLHFHKVEKCTSRFSCKVCGKRHNSVLHASERVHHINTAEDFDEFVIDNPDLEPEVMQAMEMAGEFIAHVNSTKKHSHVMLATAIVKVESENRFLYTKCLIDQGSTANLVTERVCKALALPIERMSIPITGVCDTVSYKVSHRTTFTLTSKVNAAYSIKINALIVPKITTLNQSRECWPHIDNLELADPQMERASRIDILIGAAVHGHILEAGLIKGSLGQPIAQKTQLGWIVSGGGDQVTLQTPIFTIQTSDAYLSECLVRFWETEEVPARKHFTKDEQLAEEIYVKTTKRCDDGRLMVKLPFINNGVPMLGQSFDIAKRRYNYMRKRFAAKPEFQRMYDQCIQQYLDLGHMELVESEKWPHNYLPHHPVVKESSSTTKIRPVYDASCKTVNGNSLNSQLLVGPTIQSDLFSLLIRWRKGKIAISGDIEQIYRQIWVYPEDREYQRILWCPIESDEMKSYRLKTVTFGVASAPFLAIRSLFKIADDICMEAPKLAEKIKTRFYVDDYFDSLETVEEARMVIEQISETLAKYGFLLRKWKSNNEESMSQLINKEKESTTSNIFKTLGIQWDQSTDKFLFIPAELKSTTAVWTKRTILSNISKLFDPLGWLSPCIILAKIFMQQLWLLQIGWDEVLPNETTETWIAIQNQFITTSSVKIPRWISIQKTLYRFSLQGFSDASEKAYAGVVYIRITQLDGSISCKLIAAKTKVAPLKKISIPRLELKAAVLLASLMNSVKTAINIPIIRLQAWTDSTIVLYWLANHPGRWKTFIANRVTEVQEILPSHSWRHIESEQNPADCASRGLERQKLEDKKMWWYGPSFLMQPESNWPIHNVIVPKNVPEERVHMVIIHNEPIVARFSTYERMINVTSICLRWRPSNQFKGYISPQEASSTEKVLIKIVQSETFETEIKCLRNNKPLPTSSAILKLDPFIDGEGIMRVGGRIQLSVLSENEKHPIILPQKHQFTKLLIQGIHKDVKHGGLGLTLQKIRQNYWIISARTAVTSAIFQCVVCFRFRKQLLTQKMGNLPAYRVQEAAPFTFCGIDYAGYFWVKSSQRKNAPYLKAYIALFVCLTTRAIHLELVSDCSTIQFLKALKRFIGRRGIPTHMFSDNATNFVGAAREIQSSLDQALLETKSELRQELLKCRIEWAHIPPRAPHFGGWESSVKLVKHHLKRVLGDVRLTFEDFNTLIIEIEAVVNSRPLWSIPTDSHEYDVLTPGHFLVFRALNTLPEGNVDHIPLNRLNHYQYLQRLLSDFWKVWSHEYIHSLQARKKWRETKPNIREGQIVLVAEDNETPTQWALGRIVKVIIGADGLSRVADVKIADSDNKKNEFKCKIFRRPIHKLSLLPIIDNKESMSAMQD